jgi:hypothetical protein
MYYSLNPSPYTPPTPKTMYTQGPIPVQHHHNGKQPLNPPAPLRSSANHTGDVSDLRWDLRLRTHTDARDFTVS